MKPPESVASDLTKIVIRCDIHDCFYLLLGVYDNPLNTTEIFHLTQMVHLSQIRGPRQEVIAYLRQAGEAWGGTPFLLDGF